MMEVTLWFINIRYSLHQEFRIHLTEEFLWNCRHGIRRVSQGHRSVPAHEPEGKKFKMQGKYLYHFYLPTLFSICSLAKQAE